MAPKAKFTWDQEKKAWLLECHARVSLDYTGLQLRIALAKLFRSKYPDYRLADATLLTNFYKIQNDLAVPVDKPDPILLWQPEMDAYLKECVPLAIAADKLDISLGLYEGRAGTHSGFGEIVTELFNVKYPDFREAQVQCRIFKLRSDGVIPCRVEISATLVSRTREMDIMKYWQLGWNQSTRPLFSACCYRCSSLIWKTETGARKIPIVRLFSNDVVLIETHYRKEYLDGVRYMVEKGLYYICETCNKYKQKPSALEVFPFTQPCFWLMPKPEELVGLNNFEIGSLGICGLFYNTVKKKSAVYGVFEHRQGEVNILPKDSKRYMAMLAMMIQKPPSPEQAMEEVIDELTLKHALNFLKRNNHLYQKLYSNCETLYRFVDSDEGVIRSIKLFGNTNFCPANPSVGIADLLGDEKMGLLVPHDDFSARDIRMEEISVALQHPKGPLDGKTKIPDIARVGYGSEGLEEKIWGHIFWQGTGGYYAPKAQNWSRKDYIKFRSLMLYPGFRNNPSWIFYQTDQIIKELIRSYNTITVKVGEMENPLLKKDLIPTAETAYDPYNRWGSVVPVSVPNSKSFMSSKCLDLLALSAALEKEPDYLITLTQHDGWKEFLASAKGYDLSEIVAIPGRKSRRRYRTVPTTSWEPGCSKENFGLEDKVQDLEKKAAVDLPVEMVIAFIKRFQEFISQFIKKKNDVFGKVTDWWWRMEYQKRGGIHIHMVIWCDPQEKPKENKISAEMPRFKHPDDDCLPHPCNEHWRDAVKATQIHRCRDNRCFKGPRGRKLKKCKYGFPFQMNDEEKLDESGVRYNYIRSHHEDRDVSPYVLELLLFWGGHVNVQRVTKHGWQMYLAKYIAKSETAENIQISKKKTVIKPKNAAKAPTSQLKNDEPSLPTQLPREVAALFDSVVETQPVKEGCSLLPAKKSVPYSHIDPDDSDTKRFLKLRVVNILEAVMINFGFPQVASSREFLFLPIELDPISRCLKKHADLAKLDANSDDIFYDNKLEKYFQRSSELEDVTYVDYHQQYYQLYGKAVEVELTSEFEEDEDDQPETATPRRFFTDEKGRKMVRRQSKFAVARFRHYSPYGDHLESYCLVRLLKAFPARRETVANWKLQYDTYLNACIHLGLVEKGDEAKHYLDSCARQGCSTEWIRELADRFVEEGWLADPEIEAILENLAPEHRAIKKAREEALEEEEENEMDLEQPVIPVEEYRESFTPSQAKAFDWITAKWDAFQQVCVLITGGAGVGKSFLLKALTSACKDRGLVFSKCASTGIAGYLIGGSTVHKFLHMNHEYVSAIEKGTWDAITLARTQVVYIDEVSMLTRECFEMLDQKLREFSSPHNDAPFGGKSIILLGDPAQLQPVGKHIWEPQAFGKFQVAVLRESKRQSDLEFIALLNRMRIGEMTTFDYNVTLRSRVLLPGQLQDLDLSNGGILYPKKAGKDDYNKSMLDSIEGKVWEYVAHDTDASGAPLVNESTLDFFEVMHRMGKLPPKILRMKVGAKVMLLRNLNVQHGWVNGAICTVDECTADYVTIHLNDFPKRAKTLCREQNKCPYSVGPPSVRNQIPLDLGWASTVHKGQGRTMAPAVYDANGQFASGGGYTACSRAPALAQLHLIRLGEMSEYFVEPSIKKLLEWMDVHDVCRGWDDKRKRSPMPKVAQQRNLKLLKVQKVKKQPKSDHVVPAPLLPFDDNFIERSGEFQLPPIPPSVGRDDDGVGQILLNIRNIPVDALSTEAYVTQLQEVFAANVKTVQSIQNDVENRTGLFSVLRDNDKIDRDACESMYRAMLKHHMVMTTEGDGHCLFRALSWCIFGHPNAFLRLRLLSCKIIMNHEPFFSANVNLLSTTRDVTFNDIVHFTSICNPQRGFGWGDGYNIKSIAIAARRKVFVYGELVTGDFQGPRDFDNHTDSMVLNHIRHTPNSHKAYYPLDTDADTTRRALTVLYLHAGFTHAHYLGILPRHALHSIAIEFTVYKRQDIPSIQANIQTVQLDDSSDVIEIVPTTPEKRSLKRRIQEFFSPSKGVPNSPLSKRQESSGSKISVFKRLISALTPTRSVASTEKINPGVARTLFGSPKQTVLATTEISDADPYTSSPNAGYDDDNIPQLEVTALLYDDVPSQSGDLNRSVNLHESFDQVCEADIHSQISEEAGPSCSKRCDSALKPISPLSSWRARVAHFNASDDEE